MNIVLDVSATIPALLNEKEGQETMEMISSADSVIAPELFIAELGNVLWKYVNFAGLDKEKAQELLFLGMNSIDHFFEQSGFIAEALKLAFDNNISVYDSMYLTLCQLHDHKLLSKDAKLNQVARKLNLVY